MKNIMSHVLLEGEGTSWDDFFQYWNLCESNKKVCYPTRIQMWTGAFLDKIQISYVGKVLDAHGINEPGGMTDILLDKDEYITKIEVDYMPWGPSLYMIRDLVFCTSKMRRHAFHSWSDERMGVQHIEYTLPEGGRFVAIGGKTDVVYKCVSGLVIYYESSIDPWNYTRDGAQGVDILIVENQTSEIPCQDCANMMDKLSATDDTSSLSASISTELDSVAMPVGVTSALYDSKGNIVTHIENGQVRLANGNFYQITLEGLGLPLKDNDFYVHISAPINSHVCYEKQIIKKGLTEDSIVLLEEKTKKLSLPCYKRPEVRMAIITEDPTLQNPTSAPSLLAARWFVYAKFFMAGHPAIAIAIGVTTLIVILSIGFYKNNKKLAKEKLLKKYGAHVNWGKPWDSKMFYEEIDDFNQSLSVMRDFYYAGTEQKLMEWYSYLLQINKNTLNAKSMKRITGTDFSRSGLKKFRIDVGGEGYFVGPSYKGVHSGAPDALNINGKVHNSQSKSMLIPALIHIQDWEKDSFPIEDNLVDSILMYGCGNPTQKEADEIIRCIKKDNARIDTSADKAVAEYIKIALEMQGAKVDLLSNNEKSVKEEYPYFPYSDKFPIYSIIIHG